MHLDVVELRAFYYRTKLGRHTQRVLQRALRESWVDTLAMTIVGFGFAAPMLRPFLEDARRVLCLMPGPQGVMPWPPGEANRAVLVEETLWPLQTGSVDRLLVAHGLETCERSDALLAEIWRVLAPGGRAVFIVPNRAGLWARREGTPFGFGRPYSASQLESDLGRARFLPERHSAVLFTPPSQRNFWLRTAPLWERIGRRLDLRFLAGALLVEATKQVYATPRGGSKVAVSRPMKVLEGLRQPKPKPVAGRGRGKG